MSEEIVNKVQLSGIIGLDLQHYAPLESCVSLDIKEMLYQGLMLKEKEFRFALSQLDLTTFQGKAISIFCSTDAIVPQWAYMLLTQTLMPYSNSIQFGEPSLHYEALWIQNIKAQDYTHLTGKKVSIKNDIQVPENIYVAITKELIPIVSTLMYGEIGMPKVIYKKIDLSHERTDL
jgi:hypothetical protein